MLTLPFYRLFLLTLVLLVGYPASTLAVGVQPLFDLSSPGGGPFPSDRFTVTDSTQNTGLRVNLPKPNCAVQITDCQDLDVINTLDGFNMQPRLSIPFSGPIDPSSVASATVFLVGLGDTLGGAGGAVVGINQIVWDPATNTLHTDSDQLLDQHARWVLVVTTDVRDTNGDPIQAGGFATFRHDLNFGQTRDAALKAYRKTLIDAIDALALMGLDESRIAAMSVFTTRSATAVLEKIRDQIKAAVPAPATMLNTFPWSSLRLPLLTAIRFDQQVTTSPPTFISSNVPVGLLTIFPGPGPGPAVGALVFGTYESPDYETAGRFIPPVGTRTGTPLPQGTNTIYFNLILPAGTPPPGGWPVVLFGHGNGNSKQGRAFFVGSKLASHGLAVIAINAVGHGGGPLGTLTVNLANNTAVTIPAGGRGIDVDGNGTIGSPEGFTAAFAGSDHTIIASSDGFRQTVVDFMQLVRVIQTGGIPDLSTSQIYFSGHSSGSFQGALLLAVDPDIRAAVLSSPGGASIEVSRLNPAVNRPALTTFFVDRVPSLQNAALGPPLYGFEENIPLRDQPPLINAVTGAMAVQEVIENIEWVSQHGNAVAYAPHIRMSPLPGVPARPVLIQFAEGDQQVPNPTTSALIRAGGLADGATYFRTGIAYADDPTTPKDPHTAYIFNISSPSTPLIQTLARDTQEQLATFLASDGTVTIDPDGGGLYFEVPIAGLSLLELEHLNFIP